LIRSITAREIFKGVREIKKELWGGEYWTDGYYFATIIGRGDKKVIEKYIEGQGRTDDIRQLRLFEL
jgi:putative transposase